MSAALISDLSSSWVGTIYVKTFKPELSSSSSKACGN